MRKKYSEHTLPDFLGRFEKLLISNNNGDGYFVGSGVTLFFSEKLLLFCLKFQILSINIVFS